MIRPSSLVIEQPHHESDMRQRKDRPKCQVVHLQIGHTHLVHGSLLQGDPTPLSLHCGPLLTLSHMPLGCPNCDNHHTFNLQSTLCDMLRDNRSNVSNTVPFLCGIGVGKFI
jgi:hypothetical protein